MNISITNECNRRCQYCFQKDWYLPQKVNDHSLIKEMTVEQFEQVILWYMKSYIVRHDDIRLLGGEPPSTWMRLNKNVSATLYVAKENQTAYIFNINNSTSASATANSMLFTDIDLNKQIKVWIASVPPPWD